MMKNQQCGRSMKQASGPLNRSFQRVWLPASRGLLYLYRLVGRGVHGVCMYPPGAKNVHLMGL